MASDVLYDTAWQAFLEAHTQGLVSDANLNLGFAASKAYDLAWTEATKAFELYLDTRGEDAKTQAAVALTEASRALGEVLGFIRQFVDVEVQS